MEAEIPKNYHKLKSKQRSSLDISHFVSGLLSILLFIITAELCIVQKATVEWPLIITQYSHVLIQYSQVLTQVLTQYSHVLTQYSHLLTQYSHLLTQYSHVLTQYSQVLTQYSHVLTQDSHVYQQLSFPCSFVPFGVISRVISSRCFLKIIN